MKLFIKSLSRRFRADESGQALAEFALVMPLLFLLIAGILGFGRAWNIQQVVTDASREGARIAVVDELATSDSATGVAAVRARINQRLADIAVDTTTVDIEINGLWRNTGSPIEVTVGVPYEIPILSAMMDWAIGTPNFYLNSTTTMRNE